MMTSRLRLLTGCAISIGLLAAGIQAAQRGWVMPLKKSTSSVSAVRSGVLVTRPRAAIGVDANGIYCVAPTENGVGIHDLGAIPAGFHVVLTVESYSEGFDPVAAVVVTTLGEKAANTVKVTTFYDNDSGGEGDARVDFVTPQDGNYILLVGDFTDTVVGCYRYQILIG
jgi:hypothetical protein